MGRILAIDYGTVRTGLAITDPLQIIASGLTTVPTKDLLDYLKNYMVHEKVELMVVGLPKRLDNSPSSVEGKIQKFVRDLRLSFPNIPCKRIDERFTSKMAFQTMIDSGLKQKQRRNKALVDEISATLILQSYLEKK